MSWRLALRLARREVARRPGRTALGVLLVALPVCGMALAAVLFRTDDLTATQEFEQVHGEVDGLVTSEDPTRSAPIELPAGSETHHQRHTSVLVRGPDTPYEWATTTSAPLVGPFAGRYRLVEGRAPEAPGQVVLSRELAKRAGVDPGDDITLVADAYNTGPDAPGDLEEQTLTVVGFSEDVTCLRCLDVTVHPDQEIPGASHAHSTLVRLPDDVSPLELARLDAAGMWLHPDLRPPAPLEAVPAPDGEAGAKVRWSWVVGAVVLTATGVVISAAFTVSARRQLATLGQLVATGASPRLLRRTLALQGTVTGAVGVVTGGLLTAVVLALGRGTIEGLQDKRLPAWDVQPVDLLVVAVVGVAAATLAALLPARSAARIPTLAALAGRRPLTPVPRRLTATGVLTVACGVALLGLAVLGAQGSTGRDGSGDQVWALVAMVGGVLQLLGACAVTPALAGSLEQVGRRLRGPWRLGARSLARHRTRTGAVMAAVAVTAAIALFAGGMVRGAEADDQEGYDLPDDVIVAYAVDETAEVGGLQSVPPSDVLAAIGEIVPDAEELQIDHAVQRPGTGEMWEGEMADLAGAQEAEAMYGDEVTQLGPPVVADEALLDALAVPDATRDLLDEHGLLWVSWSEDDVSRTVPVTTADGNALDAFRVGPRDFPGDLWNLAISPERARELGLTGEPAAVALRSPEPLTGDQRRDLSGLNWELLADGSSLGLWFEQSQEGITPVQIEMILAGAALVITLFVIAASLALAAAENRDEREVLTVVGARPRDLARAAGARAGLLAGLGGLLAVPLGIAPVVVVSRSLEDDLPIRPPWPSIGLLLVVVPVIVAAAAMAASAVAQRARPVRVSTATFE